MPNSVGARTHPCFTPLPSADLEWFGRSSVIVDYMLLWKEEITLITSSAD